MMHLSQAQAVARALVEQMRPFCERIEIAGSIRREKLTDIKDVEIVAIPKWVERHNHAKGLELFDFTPDTVASNTLHEWAVGFEGGAEPTHGVRWIKTGTKAIEDWEPKPDGKYWRGLLPNGCTLDLFITEPDRWGATFLVRTGSAEFSTEVVTLAKIGRRYRFNDGGLCKWFADGQEKQAELVPTPEERDVFQKLGLAFVLPSERTGSHAVRKLERKPS